MLVVKDSKRVQVLTLSGVPLQVIPMPSGIRGLCASDSDGRVWLADRNSHRVHVLEAIVP